MARYAKYPRRKRFSRRRVVKKVPKTVQRYVKSQFNKHIENKVIMYQANEDPALATDTLLYATDLSAISQGTALNQRIGNQIHIKGVHCKGFLHNNNTKVLYIRHLIIGTANPNDITASTELLQIGGGATSTLTTANGLNMLYLPINKVKFQVYHDKIMKLGGSASIDGVQDRFFNKFIKLNKKITYEANTVSADNQSYRFHNIFLVSEGDDDAVPSIVEVSYAIRVWFQDA